MGRRRRRRQFSQHAFVVILAGSVALAALLNLNVTAASAADCSNTYGSHCYGVVDWSATTGGGKTGIYVPYSNLSVANIYTDFENQELWVGTGGYSFPPPYWVEVGYTLGQIQNAPFSVNPRWYWADNRPNGGGYHEHAVTNVGNVWDYQGLWVPVDSYSSTSGQWIVEINGTYVGTSTNNPGASGSMQTGIESTNDQNVLDPTGSGVFQWLAYGGWTNTWAWSWLRNVGAPYTYQNWYSTWNVIFDGIN